MGRRTPSRSARRVSTRLRTSTRCTGRRCCASVWWPSPHTRESADVVLLGNDLLSVGTIGVDTLGIALAAFGLLNPLWAAFIHVASELAFILNSARLLPQRSDGLARQS